jgi:NAD-dependent DNA ligase
VGSDHDGYLRFTGKARLEKSLNSLLGLVQGIAIDSKINDAEVKFLNMWLSEHRSLAQCHPYNELTPVVQQAISDGVLTKEEKEDILWLCERLSGGSYFNEITTDMQKLHAVLAGIGSDSVISEVELRGLREWLSDHEHLKTCWPYDEIDNLVMTVMKDKKIDEQEHLLLKEFFSEFVAVLDDRTITSPRLMEGGLIVGLCAVDPQISFDGSTFCFTGESYKYTRSQFTELVLSLGGEVLNSVSPKLNYLVIGANGNPAWSYACYGRKVEKAVELRKKGVQLQLVHENDFHDAVADS